MELVQRCNRHQGQYIIIIFKNLFYTFGTYNPEGFQKLNEKYIIIIIIVNIIIIQTDQCTCWHQHLWSEGTESVKGVESCTIVFQGVAVPTHLFRV